MPTLKNGTKPKQRNGRKTQHPDKPMGHTKRTKPNSRSKRRGKAAPELTRDVLIEWPGGPCLMRETAIEALVESLTREHGEGSVRWIGQGTRIDEKMMRDVQYHATDAAARAMKESLRTALRVKVRVTKVRT